MRISDWSSDVCSSDLAVQPDTGLGPLLRHGAGLRIAPGGKAQQDGRDALLRQQVMVFRNRVLQTRIGMSTQSALLSATSRTMVGEAASAMVNCAAVPSICRSEEHTSELQSLMRNQNSVF